MEWLKYNTASQVLYTVLLTAGSRDAQLNPTLAAGDVKISKDGGAFANLATLPDVLPAAGAQVRIQLSATELQCKVATIRFKDQTATAEWDEQHVQLCTYGNASAFFVFDFSQATPAVNATQILGTAISTPATAGILDVNVKNIANAAVSTSSAQIGVNVVSQNNIDFGALQKTSLNAATPASVQNIAAQTGDSYARLGAPAGASHAADVAAVKVDTAAVKTKTDQLAFTVANKVDTNMTHIAGAIVNANSAQLGVNVVTQANIDFGALQKTSLNAATPASVQNIAAQTGDSYARLGAPAGASVSVDVAAVKSDTAAVKTKTDQLAFTVANRVDTNMTHIAGSSVNVNAAQIGVNVVSQANIDFGALQKTSLNAATPASVQNISAQTGDSFVRLGAPVGASVSADIAAVKSEEDLIKAKTDLLPASPAAVGSPMTLAANAVDASQFTQAAADKVWAATVRQLTGSQTFSLTGNITGNLSGSVGSVVGNVGGNVVGTVASVLGDVGGDVVGDVLGSVVGGVGTVVGPVTVGTNNDKIGYSLAASQSFSTTGAVGSVTNPVTVGTNNDKIGYALTAAYDAAKTAAQPSDLTPIAANVTAVKAKTDLMGFTGGYINGQVKAIDTDAVSAAAVSAAAVVKIQTGLASTTDIATINGKLDTIYTTEGTILSDLGDVAVDVATVVAVLPLSGRISNVALTDNIDGGVDIASVLQGVLAMTSGRFKKDYPASGQVTFYKRDNATPAFIVEISETERVRA